MEKIDEKIQVVSPKTQISDSQDIQSKSLKENNISKTSSNYIVPLPIGFNNEAPKNRKTQIMNNKTGSIQSCNPKSRNSK